MERGKGATRFFCRGPIDSRRSPSSLLGSSPPLSSRARGGGHRARRGERERARRLRARKHKAPERRSIELALLVLPCSPHEAAGPRGPRLVPARSTPLSQKVAGAPNVQPQPLSPPSGKPATRCSLLEGNKRRESASVTSGEVSLLRFSVIEVDLRSRSTEGGRPEPAKGEELGPRSTNGDMGPVEDAVAEIARGEKEVNVNLRNIKDVDAKALAAAIEKSTSLQTISLGGNQITDVGATALAAAIEKSTSLQTIWLSDNKITDVGAKALAAAVEKSTSLQFINLLNNQITNKDMVRIALDRARYRRQLLALACGELAVCQTRNLLQCDGDHAIGTRVARFLLG